MGIVAFCPNGHRVKVKDELAGRKGICPTCAARFRIPSQQAGSPAARPDDPARLPTARIVSLDPHVAATLPRVLVPAGAGESTAEEVVPDALARQPRGGP